ncbi:hypothetical protein C474_05285 [Halogeometricum pallidum JCM 14848]|uniref:DUF8151 domain-containing protein n=1 Tax=Halogeometricum pallidum JCM 14848 TaxID=1227487 RepID=M0DFG7_HALPD|nr:hypothetical protein [Halogeometricum pallidum]ELZ33467.1 hypothetical protein C474_05285 [Halogeometricum pallidum JCM 14848]
MTSGLLALLPELVEVLLFGTGTVLLSGVGLYVERFALSMVEGGQLGLGAWAAVMGAVAFGFAYLLATDKFRPRVAKLLGADA